MNYRLWLPILVACSLPARASDLDIANAAISCADAVLWGRVVSESYADLPRIPRRINLDVLWTFQVRVVRVIKGSVSGPLITVRVVSDASPRRDRDILFQLRRASDHYQWERLEADCGK